MRHSLVRLTCVAAALLAIQARPASAQSLGTFTWQLQPFCNRVTAQVVQNGGSYTLDGFDDQCGAGQRAPVVGIAVPNPDGTIGFGLTVVTVPGGRPVHIDARITLAALGGPWSDSAGNTGTLAFNGNAAGSARPAPAAGGVTVNSVTTTSIVDGSIGSADVNSAQVQLRLSGSCATGQFMVGSAATGVVTCSDGATTGGTTSTALGVNALANPATGGRNTAIGGNALAVNTAIGNTAVGYDALSSNTTGVSNFAFGDDALPDNVNGNINIAIGGRALWRNIDGSRNVAVGSEALQNNTSSDGNVAVGASALATAFNGSNTAVGEQALTATTGSNNTALGYRAGANVLIGLNNLHLANVGVAGDLGVIKIGTAGTHTTAFIAGVRGITTATAAIPVLVGTDGQLGTVSSSRRFKDDIRDMGEASARLLQLRPVTFRYTQAVADGSTPLDFGLIAEEVAEVFPELAVTGADGRIETVAYHKLPALLLNELQRLQRVVEAQAARLAALESTRR